MYGCLDTSVTKFTDYLSDRKQMVSFKGQMSMSDAAPVTVDVLQGSYWSHLFFIILRKRYAPQHLL